MVNNKIHKQISRTPDNISKLQDKGYRYEDLVDLEIIIRSILEIIKRNLEPNSKLPYSYSKALFEIEFTYTRLNLLYKQETVRNNLLRNIVIPNLENVLQSIL